MNITAIWTAITLQITQSNAYQLVLIAWLDILAKSFLVVSLPLILFLATRLRYSSILKHSFWFQSLCGIALLPVFIAALNSLDSNLLENTRLFTISVQPTSVDTSELPYLFPFSVVGLIWFVYLIPLSVSSFRMVKAYLRVRRISDSFR